MSSLSEAELIQSICERVGVPPAPEGPGDDAAVFDGSAVSVDLMIEEVHFTRAHPPRWLAEKLLAVNLSDLGAMGALPSRCVLSAALPRDIPSPWWGEFAEGFGHLAKRAQVILVGGDVTRSPGPLMLGVTLFGEFSGKSALLRSGARVGDRVMIHSPQGIGRSKRGLDIWLAMGLEGWGEAPIAHADPCLSAHLCPQTSWRMGAWALEMGANAGMDCSDGLFADLPRLAHQSDLALEIDLAALPLDSACLDMTPQERAAGGEDYGLIVTVKPELEGLFQAHDFITLGQARRGQGVSWSIDGLPLDEASPAFEHFLS